MAGTWIHSSGRSIFCNEKWLWNLFLGEISNLSERISTLLSVRKKCQYSPMIVSHRRCTTCRKRRSLRTNSFFAQYPKTSLGDLVVIMYFWAEEDTQKRTARKMGVNNNLVHKIYNRLDDICSVDIYRRPFIPFGGPTHIINCDESKFNHKAKVTAQ